MRSRPPGTSAFGGMSKLVSLDALQEVHGTQPPELRLPINYMTSPQFGQSTQMLNNYLAAGGHRTGLNPLYQIGGPRSIQLALKLQF